MNERHFHFLCSTMVTSSHFCDLTSFAEMPLVATNGWHDCFHSNFDKRVPKYLLASSKVFTIESKGNETVAITKKKQTPEWIATLAISFRDIELTECADCCPIKCLKYLALKKFPTTVGQCCCC